MKRRRHLHAAAAVAVGLASILLMQGCQTAMNTADAGGGGGAVGASSTADDLFSPWPLKFREHNLGIHCFDTYGCEVVYDGRVQAMDDPQVLQPSSASLGPEYRKNWLGGRLGFRNFPPPAEVNWTSKDGVAHQARIDFGKIFRDQLVRHNVRREDIPSYATFGDPDIHLEINDRTVNVFMLASIPLKEPRIPGNRFSTMQRDLVLVYAEAF